MKPHRTLHCKVDLSRENDPGHPISCRTRCGSARPCTHKCDPMKHGGNVRLAPDTSQNPLGSGLRAIPPVRFGANSQRLLQDSRRIAGTANALRKNWRMVGALGIEPSRARLSGAIQEYKPRPHNQC